MHKISLIGLTLCGALVTAARARSADAAQADEVISLERAALDRWGNGDPTGLLEIECVPRVVDIQAMPRVRRLTPQRLSSA